MTVSLTDRSGQLNRTLIFNGFGQEGFLQEYVNRIFIGDFEENSSRENTPINSMNIILYTTREEHPSTHEVNIEGEKQSVGRRWTLPHSQFESLWETLEFDLPLKSQLMQYVLTVIRFDKAKIDRTVLHCNQTILLYGPPGSFSCLSLSHKKRPVQVVEKRLCARAWLRKSRSE